VAIALAVFGNLGVSQVIEAKDYALAEAARPVFGAAGFSIVAIAALVSTASSINANLYAVTNVTYQLAKEGELPTAFGQPMGRSREGLVISAGLIIVLGHTFDLSEIAAVGSITILLVHLLVHLGHLRLLRETGASPMLVLTAILLILVAIVFASLYAFQAMPHILWLVAASMVAAMVTEVLLHRLTGRRVQTRTPY
jgi:amino acid transporter